MAGLSVIGLGKLGLCTACCFASKGYKVYAYDKNAEFVAKIKKGEAPIVEPGIEDLMKKAAGNLILVDSVREAVENSEITFIVVPTPSAENGYFINSYVIKVLEEIAPALREKTEFHVVDVVSTVMPGSSETIFKPLLEKASGKTCGKDFGLLYNPEFIAIGSVIRDFLNPDMVLVGASDDRSAEICAKVYKNLADNSPDIKKMSLTNAEIAKLAVNCFVTTKISFANSLAALCEKTPGTDVDVITEAIGADTRIGKKYLKGGLGFGGPCFPRDNEAMLAWAQSLGLGQKQLLGSNVIAINEHVLERVCALASAGLNQNDKVAVLGLSYKPDAPLIERSHGMGILLKMLSQGYKMSAWDALGMAAAKGQTGDAVDYREDIYECVRGAKVIVLATPWKQLQQIDWARMSAVVAPEARVVDCWRL